MNISIMKIFIIFGIISSWATQALADGKVTLAEALELIKQLSVTLNLPLEFDVSKVLGIESVPAETGKPVDNGGNPGNIKEKTNLEIPDKFSKMR